MRGGWTYIEMIFVIVIIGILAAIGIKKLSANRDDAKLSVDVANMAVCLRDANNYYLAKSQHLIPSDSDACPHVVCYDIGYATTPDSNFTIALNAIAANYCEDIDNVGGHLVGSYQFSGKAITR